MNIRRIIKFLYCDAMTFVVGLMLFYGFTKGIGPSDVFQSSLLYLLVALTYMNVHVWLGHKIFKGKMTLADKIMKCKLRAEHGSNYCVKCPDSYKCPTDLK